MGALLQVLTTCRVVFEDGFVQVQSYRVAYAVFGSLAVTSSLVSIVYRIHHAWQVRAELQKVVSGSHWRTSRWCERARCLALPNACWACRLAWQVTLSCLLVLREGNTDRLVCFERRAVKVA